MTSSAAPSRCTESAKEASANKEDHAPAVPPEDHSVQLSTHLLEQICSWLDCYSLATVSLLNRQWHQASTSPLLWQQQLANTFGLPAPMDLGQNLPPAKAAQATFAAMMASPSCHHLAHMARFSFAVRQVHSWRVDVRKLRAAVLRTTADDPIMDVGASVQEETAECSCSEVICNPQSVWLRFQLPPWVQLGAPLPGVTYSLFVRAVDMRGQSYTVIASPQFRPPTTDRERLMQSHSEGLYVWDDQSPADEDGFLEPGPGAAGQGPHLAAYVHYQQLLPLCPYQLPKSRTSLASVARQWITSHTQPHPSPPWGTPVYDQPQRFSSHAASLPSYGPPSAPSPAPFAYLYLDWCRLSPRAQLLGSCLVRLRPPRQHAIELISSMPPYQRHLQWWQESDVMLEGRLSRGDVLMLRAGSSTSATADASDTEAGSSSDGQAELPATVLANYVSSWVKAAEGACTPTSLPGAPSGGSTSGSVGVAAADAVKEVAGQLSSLCAEECMVDLALFDALGRLVLGRAGVELWGPSEDHSSSLHFLVDGLPPPSQVLWQNRVRLHWGDQVQHGPLSAGVRLELSLNAFQSVFKDSIAAV